ncbi:hypothetical protein [Devosia sp. 2618]|uniref:hypothetical protein n=1 Tax=Devosia sp. 2618 TaxID=3156454 RepID=UPI003396F70F
MNLRPAIGCLAALSMSLLPATAFAQSVNVTRSILNNEPYTVIYPEEMTATGGAGEPLTLNNPNAPLQCTLEIVPVEDTNWTPQSALDDLNDANVTSGWSQQFPGFTLGIKTTTAYQSGPALLYDGTSTDSPQGIPLTIVHTETVDSGRGYALDCIYATDVAERARPIVDFIIANFSTRSDAECCVGVEVDPSETAPAPATP